MQKITCSQIGKFQMYNYSGRFFAFGCSFTALHDRPTWADLIGREFKEYQNWARGGMGNQFIFNQLIEANLRNKFTSDDTVMVMWTSITREDRYVKNLGGWVGKGNVYNSDAYTKDWVRQYSCERGYLLRDLAVISAAKDLLEFWGVTYKFLAMMPMVNPLEFQESVTIANENKDIVNTYTDVLKEITPSFYEVIFNSQNWNEKKSMFGAYVHEGIRDPHPDPKEALEYVQKALPDLILSQGTIDYANNFKLGDRAPQYYLVNRF